MKTWIGVDVDGVLTNSFHDELIKLYNENTNKEHLVLDDLKEDIREYFHKGDVGWKLARGLIYAPGFVEEFEPLSEAQYFIDELRKEGFGIKIITAPYIGHVRWAGERTLWLVKHFKMNYDDIIVTRGKEAITSVHTLIDDKIENCEKWSDATNKISYLFARPWNKKFISTEKNKLVKRVVDFNSIFNFLLAEKYDKNIHYSHN